MSDGSSTSDSIPGTCHVTLTDVQIDDEVTHVALAGDLDVESARAFELTFTVRTAARHKPVIVDLKQLKFISSYGIGVFVACAKACALRKRKFVLVAPQPHIAEAIHALRLGSLLPMEPSVESAWAMIRRG